MVLYSFNLDHAIQICDQFPEKRLHLISTSEKEAINKNVHEKNRACTHSANAPEIQRKGFLYALRTSFWKLRRRPRKSGFGSISKSHVQQQNSPKRLN